MKLGTVSQTLSGVATIFLVSLPGTTTTTTTTLLRITSTTLLVVVANTRSLILLRSSSTTVRGSCTSTTVQYEYLF